MFAMAMTGLSAIMITSAATGGSVMAEEATPGPGFMSPQIIWIYS